MLNLHSWLLNIWGPQGGHKGRWTQTNLLSSQIVKISLIKWKITFANALHKYSHFERNKILATDLTFQISMIPQLNSKYNNRVCQSCVIICQRVEPEWEVWLPFGQCPWHFSQRFASFLLSMNPEGHSSMHFPLCTFQLTTFSPLLRKSEWHSVSFKHLRLRNYN